MINALFNQPNYVASKKLLDVSALRSEAIAANIANAEKPGYKRIDVTSSFKDELQKAIGNKSVDQISHLRPQLAVDSTAVAQARDGNTVQLEHELLQNTKNYTAYCVETQMVSASLQRLRLAITGRSA